MNSVKILSELSKYIYNVFGRPECAMCCISIQIVHVWEMKCSKTALIFQDVNDWFLFIIIITITIVIVIVIVIVIIIIIIINTP